MTDIAYPYRFDSGGGTARASADDHIRDLIEQTLFTSPGERVNRPTFGASLRQLVFAPNSDAVATAVQFIVQGALQQQLGNLIQVEAVDAQSDEATLSVVVRYTARLTQQRSTATFTRDASQ